MKRFPSESTSLESRSKITGHHFFYDPGWLSLTSSITFIANKKLNIVTGYREYRNF